MSTSLPILQAYDMDGVIAVPQPKLPIHTLANELLAEIFSLLSLPSLPSPGRGIVPSQITISHVCAHWRQVVTSLSSQWTRLLITHTRHPDVLSSILARSKTRPISVTLILPFSGVELWSAPDISDFSMTFRHLRKHVSRLQTLRIDSTTPTFQLILNCFLPPEKHISLPLLSSLHLVQTDHSAPLFSFGPIHPNPAVFSELRLQGVTLDCRAPSLAGLRILDLRNSSGTLLDQTQLFHPSYPLIPPGPAMPHLMHLHLFRTPLIPTGPSNTLTPSFDPTNLVSVTLANIRCPLSPTSDALLRLFTLTSVSPRLLQLTIMDFEPDAFTAYIDFLSLSHPAPRVPSVRHLELVHIPAERLTPEFLYAFPGLVRLSLSATVSRRVLLFLDDPTLCPLLRHVVCRGVAYARPPLVGRVADAENVNQD